MTTAVATRQDELLDHYRSLTSAQRREAAFAIVGDMADRLTTLGKIVLAHKLEGCYMDELGLNGMTPWLLAIGQGRLYPRIVNNFLTDRKMIRRLSSLPYEDQQHIGDGGTIPLLVMNDGEPTTLQVKLADVKDDDVLEQLVAPDHLRGIAEQRIWIEARKARAALPIAEQLGPFRIDQDRVVAQFVGRKGDVIDLSTAEAIVAALRKARASGK